MTHPTRPGGRSQYCGAVRGGRCRPGPATDHLHSPEQSARLQGRCPGCWFGYRPGEFVAIFDADFVPPPQWVRQVIHHFAEPGVGMVQTRWTHLNRSYSFLTEVEAILLDGHFVLEHGGRSRAGVFFNFNGTAGMWRKRVIWRGGRVAARHADGRHRPQLPRAAYWMEFKYLQDVECPAELPIEMTAFKTQQARWAKGLIQTSKKILPRVLKSNAPWHIKLEGLVPPHGEHQLSTDDRTRACC